MQSLHLQSIPAGADCAVLRVGGEVDVYTAPQLRERVTSLVANGVRRIVADLRDVDFLDSTGLGALVGSLKRVREKDGSLTLVSDTGRILQVFRITGLVRAFEIHASVPAAISADEHWKAALAAESLDEEEWCRKHGLL